MLALRFLARSCNLQKQWDAKSLKITPFRLFALDGLEESFEVALAEAATPFPLDDLEKEGRPILHRAGEDLQHVAFVVAVHQDAEFLQFFQRLLNPAGACLQLRVIGMRYPKELDALLLQAAYGGDNVVGGQRKYLD